MGDKVKPYDPDGSKKVQVEQMFDNIAHRYDFLNRLFVFWNRQIVEERKPLPHSKTYEPKDNS